MDGDDTLLDGVQVGNLEQADDMALFQRPRRVCSENSIISGNMLREISY